MNIACRIVIIVIITIMGALIEGFVLRTKTFQMYTKTRKILDLITALLKFTCFSLFCA